MSVSLPFGGSSVLHDRDHGGQKVSQKRAKNTGTLGELALNGAQFMARISALKSPKEVQRETGLSRTLVNSARAGELSRVGIRVIEKLSEAYGEPFDKFVTGEIEDVEIAARLARIAVLKAEIDALEGA